MTCPHCHEGLIVKYVHLIEEWAVDDEGEIVDRIDCDILDGDFSEYYGCDECNARFLDWEDVRNNTPFNLEDLED